MSAHENLNILASKSDFRQPLQSIHPPPKRERERLQEERAVQAERKAEEELKAQEERLQQELSLSVANRQDSRKNEGEFL